MPIKPYLQQYSYLHKIKYKSYSNKKEENECPLNRMFKTTQCRCLLRLS